jgi:hypothetical protein
MSFACPHTIQINVRTKWATKVCENGLRDGLGTAEIVNRDVMDDPVGFSGELARASA